MSTDPQHALVVNLMDVRAHVALWPNRDKPTGPDGITHKDDGQPDP